jgi:hypothetical protein
MPEKVLNSNTKNIEESLLFKTAGFLVTIYIVVTVLFIIGYSFSKFRNGNFLASSPQLLLWSVLVGIIIYVLSSVYNSNENQTYCTDLTYQIIIIMSTLGLVSNIYFFNK